MSYDYVLALVEECHRFEEKAYTRVSLEELVGNRKLIDEYAALLFRTVHRFGRRSGSRALNALGMELVEASLRLLMLRYLPSVRTCRKAMPRERKANVCLLYTSDAADEEKSASHAGSGLYSYV